MTDSMINLLNQSDISIKVESEIDRLHQSLYEVHIAMRAAQIVTKIRINTEYKYTLRFYIF